jgi:hypothetical protein
MLKTHIQKILGLVPFIILYSLFLIPSHASAQTVGLSGFAWSDLPQSTAGGVDRGAGWISFSGPGYGVVANQSSGNLSGYAWSEHYGWLSFNSAEVAGCPSGTCQPNVNPTTGIVTGWARFINAPAGTSGPWNGWVHLSGSNYGVTYSSASQLFSGYAWGDSDIGWVRFENVFSGYAVTMSPLIPPTATINIVTVPANATWSIAPGAINGTGNGTATVTPSQVGTSYTVTGGAAPSGYDFPPTITNSQGGGSSALILPGTAITFTITYTQSFNYSLSNSGNIEVQKAGIAQSGQSVVTATRTAGTGQSVTLSASGLPSGASISFSGQGCVPGGSPCNYTTTITVQPSTVSGTYPITITGSPLSRTTNFNLVVTDSPNMIISCSANPSTAQVGQDVTWTATIVNDPNSNSPYTYQWTGNGVPTEQTLEVTATQSFVTSYSTTGIKQIQATVWDDVRNQALCPTSFINIGVKPDFGEF